MRTSLLFGHFVGPLFSFKWCGAGLSGCPAPVIASNVWKVQEHSPPLSFAAWFVECSHLGQFLTRFTPSGAATLGTQLRQTVVRSAWVYVAPSIGHLRRTNRVTRISYSDNDRLSNLYEEDAKYARKQTNHWSLSYIPKLGTEWCRSITVGVERTILTDSLSSLSTPSDWCFIFQQWLYTKLVEQGLWFTLLVQCCSLPRMKHGGLVFSKSIARALTICAE